MSETYIVAGVGLAVAGIFLYVIVRFLTDKAILSELKDLSDKIEALDKKLDGTYGKTVRDIELIKIDIDRIERKVTKEKTADGTAIPNSGKEN